RTRGRSERSAFSEVPDAGRVDWSTVGDGVRRTSAAHVTRGLLFLTLAASLGAHDTTAQTLAPVQRPPLVSDVNPADKAGLDLDVDLLSVEQPAEAAPAAVPE